MLILLLAFALRGTAAMILSKSLHAAELIDLIPLWSGLQEWTVYINSGKGSQALIRSLKGEVKKKHDPVGWIFSCFAAHLCEQDLF